MLSKARKTLQLAVIIGIYFGSCCAAENDDFCRGVMKGRLARNTLATSASKMSLNGTPKVRTAAAPARRAPENKPQVRRAYDRPWTGLMAAMALAGSLNALTGCTDIFGPPQPPQNPFSSDAASTFECSKAGLDDFEYRVLNDLNNWSSDRATYDYFQTIAERIYSKCRERFGEAILSTCMPSVRGANSNFIQEQPLNQSKEVTIQNADGTTSTVTVNGLRSVTVLGPVELMQIASRWDDYDNDAGDTFQSALNDRTAFDSIMGCIRQFLPSKLDFTYQTGDGANVYSDSDGTTHVAFGAVPLGGYVYQRFYLQNNGEGSARGIQVSASLAGYVTETYADGLWMNENCSEVPPGGWCEIKISFSPAQVASYEGAISIQTDTDSYMIKIGGSGAEPYTYLSLWSDDADTSDDRNISINFGDLTVGTSVSKKVVLANYGNTTATNLRITSALENFSVYHPCGESLQVNEKCEIDVTFTPTEAGEYQGYIEITSGNDTVYINTAGRGFAPEVPDYSDAGRQRAGELCLKLYYDSEKMECAQIVSSAYHFDIGAVEICESLYYTTEKLDCLRASSNAYYEDFELELCEDQYYAADRIACLSQSGASWPRDYDSGREEAGDWCATFYYSEEQLECLSVVSQSDHIDGSALDICKFMYGEDAKLQCLSAIANKWYEGFEISICSDIYDSGEQITCLQNTGISYYDSRAKKIAAKSKKRINRNPLLKK